MKSVITYLMEIPFFYRIVQVVIGGQGHDAIKLYLVQKIPHNHKQVLDQGCGTGEYSLLFGKRYTGLDNNKSDIEFAQKKYPGKYVVGSADKMPFKDQSFDTVFAVGLHHHLTDKSAQKAFQEALRVCKKNGQVLVVDAMWPKNNLNVLGWVLRKMDRGRYVRSYHQTLKLLPQKINYEYSFLKGFPLEYLLISFKKGDEN